MKYNNKSIKFLFIFIIIISIFTSCNKTSEKNIQKSVESQSRLLLGTSSKITIYDYPSEEVFSKSFDRLRDIENKMSIRIDSSEITLINQNAGIKPVKVSEDTFYIIKEAINVAALSDGAFDPTIGPLVELWNIGFDDAKVPTQDEIDRLLPLIGYQMVSLNEDDKSVFLEKKGMMLDLGGIAKGYAADEVAIILKENNIEKAIINLGGNVLTLGTRVDDTKWRIGVQNPEEERGNYVLIVSLDSQSLVTSGPYERYSVVDGVTYHHILDSRTGYPVKTNLTSASIISSNSMLSDALSTAIYSLGIEKGLDLINSLDDVEALFIDDNRNIYISKGFKDKVIPLVISDDSFKVVEQ